MLGLRVSALGSRGGATDHFPKRDRLPASPISSAQAAPGPCFLTGSRCHHEADGHGSQGAHQHSRIASFSPHRWDGGAVPDWFFKMSRSIRTVRSSRRKRPSSSRSSVVSAPAGPWPASIPACRTQARTALSVRPSSRATTPMDFPLSRINRTVSALNSSVNARRLRLAMEHSYRTFVRSAVSTKPGQLHALVIDTVKPLALPRLTIDIDGTVVRTGATVGWAFRRFHPHHRKDPSYYPLLAHVAQTGHILRVKNRPGNVHDSKQSVAFLREVIA